MKTLTGKSICFWISLFLINLATSGITLGAEPAFTHGVASGDVTDESAVLWTRVNRKSKVKVEVAYDPSFNVIIFKDKKKARAKNDFTVKFFPDDLPANRTLYYRFHAGKQTSETGTFKTAPYPTTWADLKFAYSADSDSFHVNPDNGFLFNNFAVLNAVRAEQPDFFVYLGDTIYADGIFRTIFLGLDPSTTLKQYRADYKQNRDVTALAELMRSTSIIAAWDDHEIHDNWAGASVDRKQFRDGRKAFLEYMPMVEKFRIKGDDYDADEDGDDLGEDEGKDKTCAGDPLVRVFKWGRDVEIIALDERSCRSDSVILSCTIPGAPLPDLAPTLPESVRLEFPFNQFVTPSPPPGCLDAIRDPSRTMLGNRQKKFLKKRLLHSDATYKVILNQVGMQQLFALPYDRWEGYEAERKEILNFIRDNNIENVIFLTTDLHSNIMNEVAIDGFTDPEPIAFEAITGPISTFTWAQEIELTTGTPLAVDVFNLLTFQVGVNCRNNNTDAYGVFEYDAITGEAQITLKDSLGNVIQDEVIPGVDCKQKFGISPVHLVRGR
ncbi:MAG: alkaline phosphatase D family protein [Nitrospinota bacterium]|nr:alkaline phosphatase D family protein [Nitrospinota bacterium]